MFGFGYAMPFWLLFIDDAAAAVSVPGHAESAYVTKNVLYPFLFILSVMDATTLFKHNVGRPLLLAYTVGSGTSLVPSVKHLEITLVARASSMEPANDRMVLDELLSSGRVLSYGDGVLVVQKVR